MVVAEMSFMQPVKKFLNSNGVVYSVRKYKYGTEKCYISSVGYCKRVLIKELWSYSGEDFEILKECVENSGFGSVEEWIKMVKHFVNSEMPVYLYKVTKEE